MLFLEIDMRVWTHKQLQLVTKRDHDSEGEWKVIYGRTMKGEKKGEMLHINYNVKNKHRNQ